ncbi:MAG TPA: hypothetical protein VM286_04820 [Candidatus Thermoplasmatota archaeon]|nr:hypothetical protein [Candidatus Thermoplasmatota archaeon]
MNVWWMLCLAGATCGAVFVASHLLGPYFRWWREQPRETPLERRQRRLANAVENSFGAAADGHPWDARWWGAKACRLDPRAPSAMHSLGHAWMLCNRPVLALKHLERAVVLLDEGVCADDPMELTAEIAVDASRCCAMLRLDCTDPVEKEQWGEGVLRWARVAIESKPDVAQELRSNHYLRDLESAIHVLLTSLDSKAQPLGIR